MPNIEKKAWPWFWLSIAVVLLDQLSKYFALRHLTFNDPLVLLPFFNLTLAFNPGASFSFLGNAGGWQVYLFSGLSFLVALALLIWLGRVPRSDRLMAAALSLIIGGALGNLIDRLHYGFVIDFFDFHLGGWHFAIFNVADSAICVGAFLLIINMLFFSKKKPS